MESLPSGVTLTSDVVLAFGSDTKRLLEGMGMKDGNVVMPSGVGGSGGAGGGVYGFAVRVVALLR